MGAVGPTQIMVIVNGRVRVFNKDGTEPDPPVLDVTDATFWGSEANGLDVTDPQVEYDRLSQRWIVSEVNFDPNNPSMVNNRIMVAVSSGPTITDQSSFTLYHFDQNGPNSGPQAFFADYPQMGVDKNAIYIGVNDFSATNSFSTSAYVIRKSSVTSGGPIVVTAFRNLAVGTGGGPDSPQPAEDMDPNVNEGYIIGPDNAVFGKLDVRRITDPGGSPSISGNLQVTVPATVFPDRPSGCGSPNFCVPASGSSKGLDALDDRLYEAMIGRDENGSLSLWTAHNIEVNSSGTASTSGGRDGARWYQLGSLASNPPTLIQSGTLFDPATTNPRYFWIPSIAMNGQGHASLNASTAASDQFASVASSAHLTSDPLGMTEPFDISFASSSAYGDTDSPDPSRWGDFSQTVVDPNDNQTFWTFQEYAIGSGDWGVRVIKVKAPPPATPVSANPNTVPIGAGHSSETVQITGASVNGSGFFDPGPDLNGPGYSKHVHASVTGGVTVNSITFTDPTHVTLNLNTTAASNGSQNVTITNPDGQSATGQNVLVTGSDTTAPSPPTFGGTTPASPANDNSPKVFGSAEGGSTVRLYANSACSGSPVATGSAAQFSSGLTVSVPDNSTTTFFGTATDISNNTSACSPGSVTYVEDSSRSGNLSPPDTTITKGPTKTHKRRPKFKFTSSDPGASFQCRLDRGQFTPCASPFRPPKLRRGRHKLQVAAITAAGADGSPAVKKFKVLPAR